MDLMAINLGMRLGGGGSVDSYTKAETDQLLDGKADLVDGKVPASELPSYVDDTIEGYYYEGAFYEDSEHTTVITGERGKIYIDLTANKSYRWTGTVYVRIDECPAFGETQGTIYEGNKGKANADNIGTMSSLTTTAKSSLVAAINELNDGKADKSTTYTKTEVNAALAAKANISDLGTAAAADTTTFITSGGTGLPTSGTVYTDQQRQDAEIGSLVDRGAKNFLDYDLDSLKTNNTGGSHNFSWSGNVCTTPCGVEFTVNSDNTITVNTTSVTCDVWFLVKKDYVYKPGTYVLSGCPAGGSTTTYYIESDDLNKRDVGDSVEIPISITTIDSGIYIAVKQGVTLTNAVFKPMLCTKADYEMSNVYKPYAPTNRELYEMILAMQNGGTV